MLNKDLVQAIQSEIAQARSEGVDEDDVLWMACGAGMDEARREGAVSDEDDRIEIYAAIQAVVKQQLKQK